MMQMSTLSKFALPFVLISSIALPGCGSPEGPKSPTQLARARDDLVPIVRELPLVPMTEPLVVEFDVPPPGRNSSHELVLGLRVSGKDGRPSFEARDEVISSNIKAIVTLEGPGIGSGRQFPLMRTIRSATTDVPNIDVLIGTDGKTDGTWPVGIDDTAMEAAGLTQPESDERYLAFASALSPAPGRYRLTFKLTHTDTDVSMLASELLVAYLHKPK